MDDAIAAAHALFDGGLVTHIAERGLMWESDNAVLIAVRAQQAAYIVASLQQASYDYGADEAVAAGDEYRRHEPSCR